MKFTNLYHFLFSSRPSQAAIFLTYRCNSRCSWCNCWQLPKQTEIFLPQMEKIFKQLKNFGIKLLYLSGGEPLLRPDLLAIIESAQRFSFDLLLVTNGILLNQQIARRLVKIPGLRINVSLDSLDPELYQKIRGVDTLDRVLKNLQDLRKAYPNYPLRITMTISAANLDQAEKVYRFCQKNHFYFSPNPYFEMGRFRKKSSLHGNHKITHQLTAYYQTVAKRVKKEPYLSGFPLIYRKLIAWLNGQIKEPCGAGQELIFIDPQGLVYACQDLPPFANLQKDDLGKMWEKKAWLPTVKKCYHRTPCFIFCTRSPYILKHNKWQVIRDLLTSKKLFHYFKMY